LSEEVDQAFSYVFAWHALSDACPKCQSLNGQEFYDQDLFQEVLYSPIWGDLWDLNNDHPLTHPNCRCQLEVRVNVDVTQIREYTVLAETITRYGRQVTVYREAETGRLARPPV